MTLHLLSNENLEARLTKLVKTERKITHLILQCIAEMDRRKLYLERAYPSLFEFLVQGYGYSASAAMRRIDGARLLQQVPEVAEKIESGALNLSQISLLQRAEREVKRETKSAVPLEVKRDLLHQLANQTQIKSEQIIAKNLDIDLKPKNKRTDHKDESVTLTITFSKEEMKLLELAQAQNSHAVPERDWAKLMVYFARKAIARRESKTPATTVTAVPRSGRVSLPQPMRKRLLNRDAKCGYRDPQSGRQCESRHFLQIDHIQSVSEGGGNTPSNLQVLCGQHNRYKFQISKITSS